MSKSVAIEVRPANSEAVHWLRWVVPVLCLAPLLVLRVSLLLIPNPLSDFIPYWSAGHLFLAGLHPYSPAAVLAIERSLGWTHSRPQMMLCPPWTLPLAAATALMSYHAAQTLWFAVGTLLDCLSAVGLWLYFGGEKRKAWIAVLICATLVPMGLAELLGQITPLILAGFTAFLLMLNSGRPLAAGLLTLAFGFKPQLLYLVALAVLFWIVKNHAWKLIAGGVASYAAFSVAALLYNHNSLDYFHGTYGAAVDTSCGLGGALRSVFGMDHIWLQFLPTALGLAWFVYYWTRHKDHWDWQIHLPLLLLVSLSTAPYDWNHDYILALPALIAVAVQGSYRSPYVLLAYLGVQMIVFETGLPPVWMAAASALWIAFYWIAEIAVPRQGVSASPLPEGLS